MGRYSDVWELISCGIQKWIEYTFIEDWKEFRHWEIKVKIIQENWKDKLFGWED